MEKKKLHAKFNQEQKNNFIIKCKHSFRQACLRELDNARQIYIPRSVTQQTQFETVLIEFRWFPHLEFLLRNIIIKLYNWSHTIVCGNNNYEKICDMCKSICPNIRIIRLNIDNINSSEYDELLKTVSFWKQFHGDKLLIYQEDSFLFHNHIETFLEYDYVGAPWSKDTDHNSLCVGNGGFSLRTKEIMIQVIETVDIHSLKLGKVH